MKLTPSERAKQILADLDKREAERKQKIAAKRDVVQRRLSAVTLKEDTREMVLIGKYILPGNRAMIESCLGRATIAEHDLKFLRARGWPL